jgi:hypothetical protein
MSMIHTNKTNVGCKSCYFDPLEAQFVCPNTSYSMQKLHKKQLYVCMDFLFENLKSFKFQFYFLKHVLSIAWEPELCTLLLGSFELCSLQLTMHGACYSL